MNRPSTRGSLGSAVAVVTTAVATIAIATIASPASAAEPLEGTWGPATPNEYGESLAFTRGADGRFVGRVVSAGYACTPATSAPAYELSGGALEYSGTRAAFNLLGAGCPAIGGTANTFSARITAGGPDRLQICQLTRQGTPIAPAMQRCNAYTRRDQAPPTAGLASREVFLHTRLRTLRYAVSCPSGAVNCTDTLRLRRGTTTVGSASFEVLAGRTEQVVVTVSRDGLDRLRRVARHNQALVRASIVRGSRVLASRDTLVTLRTPRF